MIYGHPSFCCGIEWNGVAVVMAPDTKSHADAALMGHANKTMKVSEIALLLFLAQPRHLYVREAVDVHVIRIDRAIVAIGLIGEFHFDCVKAVVRKRVEIFDPIIL